VCMWVFDGDIVDEWVIDEGPLSVRL
jgi:hypothetical protein